MPTTEFSDEQACSAHVDESAWSAHAFVSGMGGAPDGVDGALRRSHLPHGRMNMNARPPFGHVDGQQHYALPTVSNTAQHQRASSPREARDPLSGKPLWLPPGETSMHRRARHVHTAQTAQAGPMRRARRRGANASRRAARAGVNPHVTLSMPSPSTHVPVGALALGASIVELSRSSPVFAQCSQLLHRQLLRHEGGEALGLSVLRIQQCRSHLDEAAGALLVRSSRESTKKSADPWLGFVSGASLDALAGFVRSGLRLVDPSGGIEAGLVVSDRLSSHGCWGGAASSSARETPRAIPALSVWRVVLAVCSGAPAETALPAFIVDYAIERRASQLGFTSGSV